MRPLCPYYKTLQIDNNVIAHVPPTVQPPHLKPPSETKAEVL